MDFCYYFFEVMSRQRADGYVDMVYLIMDCRSLANENMKLQTIIKTITTILKYCP